MEKHKVVVGIYIGTGVGASVVQITVALSLSTEDGTPIEIASISCI